MNTAFLLLAEFNQADIPLESVATKYLGLDKREAYRRAAAAQLPFPAYRAGSQKSPWLVNVNDLAEYLDKARAQARKDWQNSAA